MRRRISASTAFPKRPQQCSTILFLLQDATWGLRRDEAQGDQQSARRLADALKCRGVAERVLQEAMQEIPGS